MTPATETPQAAAQSVVVVVGGASGIGLATAQRFAAQGAAVVVADLDGDLAARRAAELAGESWSHPVQVADEDAVARLFTTVVERFGCIDSVVNCAGRNAVAPLVEFTAENWRNVIDVCLTGAFFVIKHGARNMSGQGAIVNIASLNATQPASGFAAYCAAKAGLVMLTKVAALELGERGIRVNAISPGLIATPMVASLLANPVVREQFTDNTPLRRTGTPDDVAQAAWFLCMPDLWITGETLALDGGAHTRRYPDILRELIVSTPAD